MFTVGKGDWMGGLSAAIITLPMSIAYGIAAFAALGPDFRPHAALIGLNAAMVGGFVAALLGGVPTQISGPKAPLTLIMTTVVAGFAADPILHDVSMGKEWIVLGMVSLCVAVGGITQVLSGWLGMGNIVKYIPSGHGQPHRLVFRLALCRRVDSTVHCKLQSRWPAKDLRGNLQPDDSIHVLNPGASDRKNPAIRLCGDNHFRGNQSV